MNIKVLGTAAATSFPLPFCKVMYVTVQEFVEAKILEEDPPSL